MWDAGRELYAQAGYRGIRAYFKEKGLVSFSKEGRNKRTRPFNKGSKRVLCLTRWNSMAACRTDVDAYLIRSR